MFGDWPVEAFCSSLRGLHFWNAPCFLTTDDCLISPSSCAIQERQSGLATLCVLPALTLQPVPGSECPLPPLEPPHRTLAACLSIWPKRS